MVSEVSGKLQRVNRRFAEPIPRHRPCCRDAMRKVIVLTALLLTAVSCGDDETEPTPNPTDATITITASGVESDERHHQRRRTDHLHQQRHRAAPAEQRSASGAHRLPGSEREPLELRTAGADWPPDYATHLRVPRSRERQHQREHARDCDHSVRRRWPRAASAAAAGSNQISRSRNASSRRFSSFGLSSIIQCDAPVIFWYWNGPLMRSPEVRTCSSVR